MYKKWSSNIRWNYFARHKNASLYMFIHICKSFIIYLLRMLLSNQSKIAETFSKDLLDLNYINTAMKFHLNSLQNSVWIGGKYGKF